MKARGTSTAHAYRTEDYEDVKDFARGCMRTYLILKEKAEQWNADKEVREVLKQLEVENKGTPPVNKYSRKGASALLGYSFDKVRISKKSLPYERLDQITVDILLGVR